MGNGEAPRRTARLDWTTRYFLRRLAIARKKRDSASFSEALFEVTLVAVFMPTLAVYSCVVIASLKWAPVISTRWPNVSPKSVGLLIGLLALVAGGVGFARRFGKYRADRYICSEFDSEHDRYIVFWQKFLIVTGCGIVIPTMAFAVALWSLP